MYPTIIHNGVARELTAAEKVAFDADQVTHEAERLVEAVRSQKEVLNRACENAITEGFPSSALGSAHTYPAKIEDQINLMGLMVRGTGGQFDADPGAGKQMKAHTPPQIKQVFEDGAARKEALITQCKTLKTSLQTIADGPGTIDEKLTAIEAVTWSEPA